MKIKVTSEDIGKGCKDDCSDCPIALAVKRVLKDGCYPKVFRGFVRIFSVASFDGEFSLPDEARAFIFYFDGGAKVEPFEFEVPNAPYFKETNEIT